MDSTPPKLPQLRNYQETDISRIRQSIRDGHKRILYQLPTGGGKSVILSKIMWGAARKKRRVLSLVHRYELVRQLQQHYTAWGYPPHVIAAGGQDDPSAMVTLASVQTAARRELSAYDVILVDEAHHACIGSWDTILRGQPGAIQIGVTATPWRLDNKPLITHFDVMVQGPPARHLQRLGYLAPLRVFKTEYAEIKNLRLVGDKWPKEQLEQILGGYTAMCLSEWRRCLPEGGPTIFFTCGTYQCEYTLAKANELCINAAAVHSKMPREKREKAIADYANGNVELLICCDLIDEGFDVPETRCVLQARATESVTKHFQQIGRMMRPKADNGPGVLIDMGGNIDRIFASFGFGLPTDIVEWSLGEMPKPKKEPDGTLITAQAEREIVVGAHARKAIELHDQFVFAGSLEEALALCQKPEDILVLRKVFPNRNGKKYHIGACIHFCREIFFPKHPFHSGMTMAADALGYRSALEHARRSGMKWALSHSQDQPNSTPES